MTDTGRNLSNTAKAAVFAQSTDEVFITLVTIDHPNFATPIRVCDDPFEVLPSAGVRGVVSRSNEYIFLPFFIEPPTQDDTGVAKARIQVDNVSQDIVGSIRSATSALSISMEIVLASDVDTPEVSIPDFRLERVTYDALTITGEISAEYFDLEPYPARRFTPSDFPGMF